MQRKNRTYKRIAFLSIDKPPAEVASYAEHYIDTVRERLELSSGSYLHYDLNETELNNGDFDNLSCVIFLGLWPTESNRIQLSRVHAALRKIIEYGIPTLAIGTAEKYLLDILGCRKFKVNQRLGFNLIHNSVKEDLLSGCTQIRWCWTASNTIPIELPSTSHVILSSAVDTPILTRHSFDVYSTPATLGISFSLITLWLICHPQYLKGNEAFIEQKWDDREGIKILQGFIDMWHCEYRRTYVH